MTSPDSELRAAGLLRELRELESADDFLHYFGIVHDPAVVQVNRLHIMQRFHDYLAASGALAADGVHAEAELAAVYRRLLNRAYEDFVHSDARTEKVFEVFRRPNPRAAFVPLHSLRLETET